MTQSQGSSGSNVKSLWFNEEKGKRDASRRHGHKVQVEKNDFEFCGYRIIRIVKIKLGDVWEVCDKVIYTKSEKNIVCSDRLVVVEVGLVITIYYRR